MENTFFNNDEEKIEHIRQIFVSIATGTKISPELNRSYISTRKDLLNSKYSKALPLSIRSNLDLSQFWSFIKDKSPNYQGRRDILKKEFQILLDANEHNSDESKYHIRITLKKGVPISNTLFSCDNKESDLERFITAYHQAEPIFIEGKTVNPEEIDRFNIAISPLNFDVYVEQAKQEIESSQSSEHGTFISFSNSKSKAFNNLEDVTSQFIKYPLGGLKVQNFHMNQTMAQTIKTQPKFNKVFIVHGRDDSLIHEVQNFLYSLSLEGIVLNQELNQGRTIIQKLLDLAFDQEVGFGIVLYTPDDLGQISAELEQTTEMKARARQNVIFEHGLLVGKLGMERVIALKKSDKILEMPNDLSGVIYQQYDVFGKWKYDIAKEMIGQGYDIDLSKIK